MKDFFTYCKINKIYICIGLMLLYIFPTISNNIPFNDDFVRINYAIDWSHDGRVLSSILMKMISIGDTVLYLSPLTAFISIILISISCFYFSYKLNVRNIFAINLIPLGALITPFFLNRINYQFDFLPMTCAFSLAITSATYFAYNKINIKNCFLLFVMLLALMLFYQADINCFYIIFLFCLYIRLKEETFKNIFKIALIGFLISIFSIFLGKVISSHYIKPGGNSYLTMLSIKQINIIVENYTIYFRYWFNMYNKSIYGFICGIAAFTSLIILFTKSTKKQKIVFPILIFSFFFFISGPLIFFNPPVLGGRILISFSAIYLCLFYSLFLLKNKYTFGLIFITLFCHYVQAYCAFNIQREQYELDMNIYTSYVRSINNVDTKITSVNIIGEPPFAEITNNTSKSFPVTSTHYDIFFHRYTRLWNMNGLFTKYGLVIHPPILDRQLASNEELADCRNIVEFNRLYNVLVKFETIIFDFNKTCPTEAKYILNQLDSKNKIIFNKKLKGNFELISLIPYRVSLLDNVILEFNESLLNEAQSGDDYFYVHFFEEGKEEFLHSGKLINEQVKIGNKYYILSPINGTTLDKINKINFGFYNTQTKIISSEFSINLK